MAVEHVFAGLPVADLDAAIAWYERVLGRPPDMTPHEGERVWQLRDAGWIYVVRDEQRAGNGLLTLLVDDLAACLADLARRGVTGGEVEERVGAYRRCVLTDPAGNRVTVAEPFGAADA